MKYYSAGKPIKCPDCGSGKIARILYGLPAFSESLRKGLKIMKLFLVGPV